MDAMMKRGTIDHPKMVALAQDMRVERLIAVGLMESLWHFASKYAPQGDIGRFTNQQIAAACHWPDGGATLHEPERPDADGMVDALVRVGWLDEDDDHRLLVHDWQDHADQGVRKSLKNKGLSFFRNPSGILPESVRNPSGNGQEEVAPATGHVIGSGRGSSEEGSAEGRGARPSASERYGLSGVAKAAWELIPAESQRGGFNAFLTAVAAAVKEWGADPEHICRQAVAYYHSPVGKSAYRKHPHNFVEAGMYEDPPEAWEDSKPAKRGLRLSPEEEAELEAELRKEGKRV